MPMEREPATEGEAADSRSVQAVEAEPPPQLGDASQLPFTWEPRVGSVVRFAESAIVMLSVGGGCRWLNLPPVVRTVHVDEGLLQPKQKMLRAVVTTRGEENETLFEAKTPHWKLAVPIKRTDGRFALLLLLARETVELTMRQRNGSVVEQELAKEAGTGVTYQIRARAKTVHAAQPLAMYLAAFFPTEEALAAACRRFVGDGLLQGSGFIPGSKPRGFGSAVGVGAASLRAGVFDPRDAAIGALDWGKCAVYACLAESTKEQNHPTQRGQGTRSSRHSNKAAS